MVTYFRPNSLKTCVDSILSNTKLPFKLYIIDNSHGGIDSTLKLYEKNKNILIYKNSTNMGKGAAFMRYYNSIIKKYDTTCFISIDPDIKVSAGWLSKMLTIKNRIRRKLYPKMHMSHLKKHNMAKRSDFGLLAPILLKEKSKFDINNVTMHTINNDTEEIVSGIYRNRYTAGPLLLINKNFFEAVNGYPTGQFYGNEDGYLCKKANHRNLFTGFTTSVIVNHLDIDDDEEYIKWKKQNVHGNIDHKGRWD